MHCVDGMRYREPEEGSFQTKADGLTVSFTKEETWVELTTASVRFVSLLLLSFLSPVAFSKSFQENSHLNVKSQTQTHQEVVFFSPLR